VQRARAAITYGSGSPGVVTIYGTHSPAEDDTSGQALLDRLEAALTAVAPIINSSTAFVSDGTVDDISAASGNLTGTRSLSGFSVSGSSGTSYAPKAVALCVNWLTSTYIAGRRLRGRTFVSPLSQFAQDNDGSPTSTALGYADDFGDAWLTGGPGGITTVVWHRPTGGSGGSTAQITAHSVADKFAVLRSRRD
jgi:hypothetical protein